MSNDHHYDDKAAQQIKAVYQADSVVARRKKTLDVLNVKSGESVLDIGFGPGYFALDIAERVGATGKVSGIDNSESILAIAEATCAEKNNITLRLGDATKMPFSDGEFDAAIAVQVYAYVVEIQTALHELYRILRPGGRAVIADIDWGSLIWHSNNPERMTKFISHFCAHFPQPYLPRLLKPLLRKTGFKLHTIDSVVMLNTELDPYIIGLSKIFAQFIGNTGITSEEISVWEADLEEIAQNDDYFFSANQYLFLVEKPR